jgi:hypothetical protein
MIPTDEQIFAWEEEVSKAWERFSGFDPAYWKKSPNAFLHEDIPKMLTGLRQAKAALTEITELLRQSDTLHLQFCEEYKCRSYASWWVSLAGWVGVTFAYCHVHAPSGTYHPHHQQSLVRFLEERT